MNSDTPGIISDLADMSGGIIHECEPLPDGSGFATMSLPLPEDHWLYETDEKAFTPRPHYPMRAGAGSKARDYLATLIVNHGGKYGVKCATSNGREDDFDPDALVRNIEIGLFGIFTEDGLHRKEIDEGFTVSDAELFDPLDTTPTLAKVLLEAVALAIHDGLLTPAEVEEATTAFGVEAARDRQIQRVEDRRLEREAYFKAKGWDSPTTQEDASAPTPENDHE